MPVANFNFDTGPATLPDVGILSYNGCVFSPLFETKVSGTVVKDNANRTTKLMEYTLLADGYVTYGGGVGPGGFPNIAPTVFNLRRLLSANGGALTYQGRGFDLTVNQPGGITKDVAWGPQPKIIEFQPLGGGLSAKVQWQCVVRIPEINVGLSALGIAPGIAKGPLFGTALQFNYETSVSYDQAGYSSCSIRGTLEIPLTRSPTQATRTVATTVDSFRSAVQSRILASIDLTRFTINKRDFNVSRDKRTLEWSVEIEEKPYMDLPANVTMARGTYSVRPSKQGPGLTNWLCTLKATYTVPKDRMRRNAWFAFLNLLRVRIAYSNPAASGLPANAFSVPVPPPPPPGAAAIGFRIFAGVLTLGASEAGRAVVNALQGPAAVPDQRVLLVDFNIDEGLYQDSRTVSFSATWKLIVPFQHILLASGLWRKVPEATPGGSNLWAMTVGGIMGSESWLPNRVDPALDAIVDFGGG